MKKKKIVVLTGAGMSVESGLETFRDADGLWAKYRVEDVCTPQALMNNPDLVRKFYNERRVEAANAQPNKGHQLVAELEKDYDVEVVTQNVDDLHERAGSSKVIHLHGELMKCASISDPYTALPLPDGRLELTKEDVDSRGVSLRPFVVFFGESVPRLEEAARAVEKADILLIIGTSLNVYPAAGLIHYTHSGVPIYLIDPKDVHTPVRVTHIRKGASEGMKEFMEMIKED